MNERKKDIMKNSKKSVKLSRTQKSISSFFTAVPSASKDNVEKSSSASCGSHSKSPLSNDLSNAGSRKISSPSKKRKREDTNSTQSPKMISPTPSEAMGLHSPSKRSKKISLVSDNSVSNSQSRKDIVNQMKTETVREDNTRNCKNSSPQKKVDQSSRKELNPLKSPANKKNSPPISERVKSKSSTKLILSPIKTEDDEVLKNILEHLSPQCKTSSRKISSEKIEIGITSKLKRRNSLQSPPDTPEVKYPALQFAPKIPKPKSKDDLNVNDEVFCSPTKLVPIVDPKISPKKLRISLSPVRRSPRKCSSSAAPKHERGNLEERVSSSKPKEEVKAADKENVVSPLRRSPRKHVSVCTTDKPLKNCEFSNKLGDCSPISKGTSSIHSSDNHTSDKLVNECHDINAVLQDDFNDIMSYMASVNELEFNHLDLHEAQLCEVLTIVVEIPFKEVVLHVKGIGGIQNKACCRVRGCWLACPVSEGDTIGLQAEKVNGEWLLDNTRGFLVLHPDTLISGTTVVGSLFCARRSVLSHFFRGMDSDSAVMVTGSIIHELFQMVLKQKKRLEHEVRQLADQLISSKECVRMLYAANMTVAQIQREISGFVPRIVEFVEKFIDYSKETQKSKKSVWLGAPTSSSGSKTSYVRKGESNQTKSWNGKIVGVRDIEETLWDPKLGIKGMVDVSVDVRDMHGNRKVMPLELKTGRASFSAEHRGQVTLYSMMMSRIGITVDSGLLLYLREGQMQEVSVSHNERKDLIQLRNSLAHFIKPRLPVLDEQTNQFAPPSLPEPINFKNACEKCPYATLCSAYLKRVGLSDLPSNHPMISISSSVTQHLTEKHIDYFMHWSGLLLLEDIDQLQSAKLRHIWRFSPVEREKGRQAIVNLRLLNSVKEIEGKFHHTFSRQASVCNEALAKDLRESGLSVGSYILISTDKRLAIERGNIIDIDSSSVKVVTNRNLHVNYANETFHLDISESNTVLVFNLTNLGCLLDDNESAGRLRKIIIDRDVPSFSKKVERSIIQDCMPIFSKLNKSQRNALVKTLRADSHLLIKGLPGTGKTATMVALVQLLVRAGLSVLVTSHTHSAVDNLLLRLKKAGLQFLRLGADDRIHPQLQPYSESSLTKHCKTPEDLENVYSKQQIVGVTCLGAGHASLSQRRIFDVCLVDESTQVLQPSILRPLLSARRFVLVGDPEQLPPVVKCHQAQELGLSESLFARLDSELATVSLTLNYRMNQVITDLANGLTYEGELKCGNEKVANATLNIKSPLRCEKPWLMYSLATDIDKSVVFVDTSGASIEHKAESISGAAAIGESSCCNPFEQSIVIELLNAFVNSGVVAEEIGVMAPYRAQVSLLTQSIKANPKLADVEVNTVDQFQGRDKEVVIYSCTKSDGASNYKRKDKEILNDKRRLTVAITRAKHKLVMIGHCETLKLYTPFQKLLSCLSKSNCVSVYPCD